MVVAVLAIVAIVLLLGGSLTTEGKPTNNPVSERADEVRLSAFPSGPSNTTDILVIRSEEHTVDSPQFASFVRDFLAEPKITALDDAGAALVSEDRHATIVPIALFDDDETEALVEKVEELGETPFAVSVTGEETLDYDVNLLSQEDLQEGELQFGLPAALIILLLVFGAVVAGLVPLLMAVVSIVVALGLTALLAQQFELSVFVINMLTAMGLALGIDYSLFVVSRYREERGRGRSELAAIEASGSTASRAVLFSGAVFVIAMFGMLVVPSSIMRSLAAGAILVGIVSVVAAVTLLPAVLSLLGDRVNALRIPLVGRRTSEASNPEGRFWAAIVRRVLARPGLSLALSAGLLTGGVGSTARIITGAALIIVAVFAGFARGDSIEFQQMGFGIAVALLIDATVVRSVLLPSAMKLLGGRNRYLPHWLGWLPRLQVEAASSHPGARPPLESTRG